MSPEPEPVPESELAAPVPSEPAPATDTAAGPRAWWHFPLGFGILIACLEVGESLKHLLGLIVPGNMIGLFILLILLATGAVPLRWVEGAGRWLLWLLPFLFLPIFVYALHNRDFWLADHGAFAGMVTLATLLLWLAVGRVAQSSLTRRASPREGQP